MISVDKNPNRRPRTVAQELAEVNQRLARLEPQLTRVEALLKSGAIENGPPALSMEETLRRREASVTAFALNRLATFDSTEKAVRQLMVDLPDGFDQNVALAAVRDKTGEDWQRVARLDADGELGGFVTRIDHLREARTVLAKVRRPTE